MPINPATQTKWANYLKGRTTKAHSKRTDNCSFLASTKESKFVE